MNRSLKIALITLGSLGALIAIGGLGGWLWLKSSFLDFEKGCEEKLTFEELYVGDFSFLDRNGNGQLDTYEDTRESVEVRVEDALTKMTLDEKIHLLKGSGLASALGRVEPGKGIPGAVGTIVPTPRLGLPTIYLSDGPAGLRIEPTRKNEERTYYCTAFPIGSLLSSTWSTEIVEKVGAAMGKEALEYGIDVILGPGANIHRHPFCGRNFEYYSEDPLLTGNIGAAMVNGIESKGVGTSVKHFVANNQETNRNLNDVIVSDRAMHEIYLKGFEIIVEKSQPWTIMSSYNKVNGIYVAENRTLLTDVLRDDWQFEGLVMTDWFGGKDAPAMIRAGNDLLEPGTNSQWKALKKAVTNGNLSQRDIDISARRILQMIFRSQKMKGYQNGNNPDLKLHAAITRQSAAEGMVLLKNGQVLPIQNATDIALIGVTSYDFIAGGTGSGDVNEAYTVSLEEGLKNAGFTINDRAKKVFETFKANNKEEFVKPEGINTMTQPYDPPEMVLTSEELAQIAASSDLGIVTIGRNSGEGGDRVEKDDFLLSSNEQEMITKTSQAFHAVGKKVVVVLNIGGVIETASWKALPDAILLAWQGGQEGGNAVADILTGAVNPSGKLPMTFPINLNDHASNSNFPLKGGVFDPMSFLFGAKEKPEDKKIRNEDYTLYEEGIYVGYRHFDKAGLEVSFPFGYGLSYTHFEYTNLNVQQVKDSLHVSVSVQNMGTQSGKEVIQVYVSKPNSSVDRPTQELKAFVKTKNLNPQQAETVMMYINLGDLRYWDESKGSWTLEEGTYTIRVGASSRDVRLTQDVQI